MGYRYIVVLVLFYLSTSEAEPSIHVYPSCHYLGVTYNHGDAWVDKDTCDVCQCGDYGLHCRAGLDGTGCKFSAYVASPGDKVCVYGYSGLYLVGQVFKLHDGCNKCTCTEGGMQCTNNACNPKGFEQGTTEPIYGECHYNGLWYRFHTQWLAVDRCNTCFCTTIGNYQGGYACSTMKCSNINIITG
ncbi:hypothetical protein ACF0H5_006218 [Mactra antiquata]